MTVEIAEPNDRQRVKVDRWHGLALWATIATAVVLIWAVRYSGWVRPVAEWQFDNLTGYFPALTLVLSALIVTIPFAILFAIRRRRRTAEGIIDHEVRALRAALRIERFFVLMTIVSVIGALASLIGLGLLPRDNGTVQPVVVGKPLSVQANDGPARLIGDVDMSRIGRLTDRVAFASRDIFVAPVYPRADHRPHVAGPVAYFTEVRPVDSDLQRFEPVRVGVIRANGLPQELVPLFRGVGLAVVDHPALLLPDTSAWAWKYWAFLGQCLVLSAIAALFFIAARRYRRRLIAQT